MTVFLVVVIAMLLLALGYNIGHMFGSVSERAHLHWREHHYPDGSKKPGHVDMREDIFNDEGE